MLGEKIRRHHSQVWLINTGWTGGPYGEGGRIKLPYTRAMVRAILEGKMEEIPVEPESIFGLQVPTKVPEVPSEVLRPRNTWKNPEAYDRKAQELARQFRDAFQDFEGEISPEVREAGPKIM